MTIWVITENYNPPITFKSSSFNLCTCLWMSASTKIHFLQNVSNVSIYLVKFPIGNLSLGCYSLLILWFWINTFRFCVLCAAVFDKSILHFLCQKKDMAEGPWTLVWFIKAFNYILNPFELISPIFTLLI